MEVVIISAVDPDFGVRLSLDRMYRMLDRLTPLFFALAFCFGSPRLGKPRQQDKHQKSNRMFHVVLFQ